MQMHDVVPTLSPAMDIQVSSNFERLLFELWDRDGARVAATMESFRKGGEFAVDGKMHGACARVFDAARARRRGHDARRSARSTSDRRADRSAHRGRHPCRADAVAAIRPCRLIALGHGASGQVPRRGRGGDRQTPATAAAPGRSVRRARSASPCCRTILPSVKDFIREPARFARRGMTPWSPRSPTACASSPQRMDTVETVSLGVWVDVGTRHEPPELNGVAHMLEHMAFKGTKTRSARAIAEEIEAVGGHLNAYTGREITAFHAKVLKDDVALAVDIIADILQNSVFDEEELDARARRDPAGDRPGRRHARRRDLRPVPGDRLSRSADRPAGARRSGDRGAHRCSAARSSTTCGRHYAAPRMVIAARRQSRPRTVSSSWSPRPLPRCRPARRQRHGPPRSYRGGEFRETRDLEQVHLVLGFAGLAYADPDYFALQVLSTLLGGGMSSRLFQEIRESAGWSTRSIPSASYSDTGLFGIYAGTGEEQLERADAADLRRDLSR